MMQNLISNINELLNKFVVENLGTLNANFYIRLFSSDKQYSLIDNESTKFFKKTIDLAHRYNPDIRKTLSFNYFEKAFRKLIVDLLNEKSAVDENVLKTFFKTLSNIKNSLYYVLKPIAGIKLEKDPIPEYGPVRIIKYANILHRSFVKQLAKGVDENILWGVQRSEYYALVSTNGRDQDLALDRAEEILHLFEIFLKFAIGRSLEDGESIEILNITLPLSNIGHLIREDGTISSNYSNRSIIRFISIDDEYFFSMEAGNNQLWNILTDYKKNPTEMQSKIVQAILWVGKAFNEKDRHLSLLQFTMALEALFSNLQSGVITPGIAYSISENVAFILGKNYDDRTEIEKIVKKIYGLRSAITHGNSKEISDYDLIYASRICLESIREFLRNDELKNFRKVDELVDYLKRKKYE
ncbi:hypothetical protein LEP1GSC175_1925 [Leptospira santarosai str. HAI821]|uniref:HEPN domain-containing protein n=1 Tax=Leptospira santarosai TaxID=28183 RepID=UPI0002BE455A|nr:HEPN domain-containing protein [Leptospira santarosai]EMO33162.1 hypothetical protein LEP1GSC175_1925 [Leptospira santarosai str. HAI821]